MAARFAVGAEGPRQAPGGVALNEGDRLAAKRLSSSGVHLIATGARAGLIDRASPVPARSCSPRDAATARVARLLRCVMEEAGASSLDIGAATETTDARVREMLLARNTVGLVHVLLMHDRGGPVLRERLGDVVRALAALEDRYGIG